MRRLLFALLFASALHAANTVTLYDRDNSTAQRPVTFGRPFVQGEAATCAKPTGTGIDGTNWQVDVKNRWGDGSIKFAIVTVYWTPGAGGGNTVVTISPNASCNNSGGLTAAQMANFNSGSWGGQMAVTFNGVTTTPDAKTMLAQNDPNTNAALGSSSWPDCKNDLWVQGPAVTGVIIQDCTSTTLNDFGGKWDGTTMNLTGGNAYTGNCGGNPCYASLHPVYILWFYPITNQVKIDMILENDWTDRMQDQMLDIVYKTGSTPTAQLTLTGSRKVTDLNCAAGATQCTSATSNFNSPALSPGINVNLNSKKFNTTVCSVTNATTIQLCSPMPNSVSCVNCTAEFGYWNAGTRSHKTFWSGAGAAAFTLIAWNTPYLATTKVTPPFDTSSNVTSVVDSGPDFNNWKVTDQADHSGMGGVWAGGASNPDEGSPASREDAILLYASDLDCGTNNGKCAKAWYVNTATHGSLDNTVVATTAIGAPPGGAGAWNFPANISTHARESRTGNYYSSAMAGKDATGATAFGTNSGTGFGKTPSRYVTDTNNRFSGPGILSALTGATATDGMFQLDLPHWEDHTFYAYLLTGNYFYLDELQQQATWAAYDPGTNPAFVNYGGGGRFTWINSNPLRRIAWGLQSIVRAAAMSPDAGIDQTYWQSISLSNAEIQEGIMNIKNGVGGFTSSLTPTTTNDSCTAYKQSATNRWNWGRCTERAGCNLNDGVTNCADISYPAQAQALHNLGMPQATVGLPGNGGGSGVYVATLVSVGATTTFSVTNSPPPNGTVITFMGAQDNGGSNWSNLNLANHTVSGVSGKNFTVDFNSTGYPALVGDVQVTWGGFGLITSAVQNGNGTVTITSNNLPGNGTALNITGCSGGWTNLCADYTTLTRLTTTTATVASTGNTGGFPAGVYYSTTMINSAASAAFTDPWMEHFFGIVSCEAVDLGFSEWSNVCTEAIKRELEGMLDSTSQPYVVTGQYVLGVTGYSATSHSAGSSGQADGTSDFNPTFTTWAQIKSALPSIEQSRNSYNGGNSDRIIFQCGGAYSHDYPTIAKYLGAFFGSTSSSDANCTAGLCTAADGLNWLNANTAYFNNAAAVTHGCANNDGQLKWAAAPRAASGDTCTINTISLPNGTINSAYSQTLSASCTTGSLVWAIVSGALPTGMTLHTGTGVIDGTPTVAGTFNFSISVTDSGGGTATQPYALVITPGISITPTGPFTAQVGTAFSQTMTASGGTAPYTYSIINGTSPLPIDPSTGIISGTPANGGVFTFTVHAVDANSAFGNQQITLTITNFGTGVRNKHHHPF